MVGRTARPDSPGRAVSVGAVTALLLLWLLTPARVAAQDVVLAGRVVDGESGAPVVGGTVRVLLPGAGQGPGTRTDASGRFRLSLGAGRHAITIAGEGYETLRLDGIQAPWHDAPWVIRLTPLVALHDPLITSPDRTRLERISAGTTSASVVGSRAARDWDAFTHADLVEGLPGLAMAWIGIEGRSAAVRGFNGVFTGGPLLLEDERIAQMPSSRINAFESISSALLDVERVELLRGPMSALYGPNAAGGALRIVTSSPIDHPGTVASLTAGQRDVFNGAARVAVRTGDRSGIRLSGQYFRGRDWTDLDPAEVTPRARYAETGGAQARYDLRPWEDGEIVLTAGVSRMVSSVLLLREGPAQATDWSQASGQARVRKGRLSALGFVNRGDAGSSIALRTGAPIVDRSSVRGARVQYGRTVHDLLDLTAGLDATRTAPGTEGTIHGAWEDDDGITEVGGYVYGVATPVERTQVVGALRLDRHSRFQAVRFSPRLAVMFEVAPRQKVHAAFNRGYTYPTPDLLFADRVTARIPLLDTLGFDVRVVGLPDQGLTFDRRCPGGLEDRCMFSPFLPGVRLPATGATLWDAVLVPLALESESVRSTLAGMGISPNGFAQIIGRPGPTDLGSRLVRWTGDGSARSFEPAPVPGSVARLRPAITESVEAGFRGASGSRLSWAVDLYAARVTDLVGPLGVATPTLYLDGASVDAFLLRRMIAVGIPPGVADGIAASVAATAASVPLGTLAPDQREGSDVVLAYRNLGAVRYWGADLGARWQVATRLSVVGSLTFLSEECFELDGDAGCGTAGDVTLNAPTLAGSATVRWRDPATGVTLDGRVRHAGDFPVSAGGYRGDVAAHTLLDVSGRFLLPWAPGASISVTVTNVLDAAHRDFVSAPAIGRLALMSLRYAF